MQCQSCMRGCRCEEPSQCCAWMRRVGQRATVDCGLPCVCRCRPVREPLAEAGKENVDGASTACQALGSGLGRP